MSMKTFQFVLFLLLISVAIVIPTSCGGGGDDDPTPPPVTPSDPDNPSTTYTLAVSPSSLSFGYEGGLQTVAVTTNATNWTVESSQAWCKVTQSGTTLSVSVDSNSESQQRTAVITVKATGVSQSQTITITQANADGKYCTTEMPDRWLFNYEASSQYFLMSTNIDDFTVTSTESWCTAYIENGLSAGKKQLVINVTNYEKANSEGYYENELPRLATVHVIGGSVFDRSILIVQESHIQMYLHTYNFVDGYLELSPKGETKEVTIETNCYSWTPYTDADWLTVKRKDGNTIIVTSKARPAYDTNRRQAVVKVVNDADEYNNNEQFLVRDAQADIHGENYGYDNPTGWD